MLMEATAPRLGFLGLGWIGRNRMQALSESGTCRIVALADQDPAALQAAAEVAPAAEFAEGLAGLLARGLDGIVIATPSALHADQAIAALEAGCAVFCQKPLARTEAEARAVVECARAGDLLLGVDLSYRHAAAFRALHAEIGSGRLGTIHALDLTFHNAYGPDKAWFRDRRLSGGGCVIDLGTHLIDTALWLSSSGSAECRHAALFHQGRRLAPGSEEVEDFAYATFDLPGGAVARIACSWNLPAGCEAVIEASVYGEAGGVRLRNIGGSFYDFETHRLSGTSCELLACPPDAWGGRAAVHWACGLAAGRGFDPSASELVTLSGLTDAIYAAA